MSKTTLGEGTKQKITVTVDSNLIADIDNLSNNRSAAVEEALFLWRKQQFESKLREFYLNRSQEVIADEDEWCHMTQDNAIANWQESKENN